MKKNKYIYISDKGPSIILNKIEELEEFYYEICNVTFVEMGLAEKEFYENMDMDGYIIINSMETYGDIQFFIETNKISTIIEELGDCEETKIIKNKLI